MKNILILIAGLFFFTSCDKDPIEHKPTEDYSLALDTLQHYSDYILGDFDNKFLVSTDVRAKNYSASIVSNPQDSSYIQFQMLYKLLNEKTEKSAFLTFRFLDSKTKLDSLNHYRYKYFSDFVEFFDRTSFPYYQITQPIETIHSVGINYQNYYEIDNDIYGFDSFRFEQEITPENFNFFVDSINVIEKPIKKVEVYYSFKCLGTNYYGDNIVMENGKGKATFDYNN